MRHPQAETMKRHRKLIPGLLGVALVMASCQPTPPATPMPRESDFNFTLLGFWKERFIAWDISKELKAMGIRNQVTNGPLTAINVESDQLSQARAIVARHPEWAGQEVTLH